MTETVDKAAFRAAMARVCAAVNVITTDGAAGRGGFTATAMCSVSDDPPTLLVCMNGRSAQTTLFLSNGLFCVNVLTAAHQPLAQAFAGGTASMPERYAGGDWLTMPAGTPAITDAIVSLECRIEAVHRIGTHNVMIGQVLTVRHRPDGAPLVYLDRRYHPVPPQSGESAA